MYKIISCEGKNEEEIEKALQKYTKEAYLNSHVNKIGGGIWEIASNSGEDIHTLFIFKRESVLHFICQSEFEDVEDLFGTSVTLTYKSNSGETTTFTATCYEDLAKLKGREVVYNISNGFSFEFGNKEAWKKFLNPNGFEVMDFNAYDDSGKLDPKIKWALEALGFPALQIDEHGALMWNRDCGFNDNLGTLGEDIVVGCADGHLEISDMHVKCKNIISDYTEQEVGDAKFISPAILSLDKNTQYIIWGLAELYFQVYGLSKTDRYSVFGQSYLIPFDIIHHWLMELRAV